MIMDSIDAEIMANTEVEEAAAATDYQSFKEQCFWKSRLLFFLMALIILHPHPFLHFGWALPVSGKTPF